ncbi:MAG: dihydrofolate reductase [Sphingobacteriales bacterium]|nr:MAG: dihydrofolate reductase [Sphingobacteriales bacterium]
MNTEPFTITVHMVASLDGYIAKKDNSVSWFETTDHYEYGVEDDSTEDFLKSADCFVMGSNTYEHALELSVDYGWVYGEVPTIVVTHRNLPVERKSVELFAGDLQQLVNERLKPHYRNVWVVGGAKLVSEFIRSGLADEIRYYVLPVILGDGVPFFENFEREYPLHLKGIKAFKSGLLELRYEIRK